MKQKKQNHITCILSDLGKVVADFDNELTVARFAQHTAQPPAFLRSVLFHADHGLQRPSEAGEFTTGDFRTAVRKACSLDPKLSDDDFDDIYANVFTPMTEVMTLWGRLRNKGITLSAVSNIDELRWEPLVMMGIPERFDHLILSYEEELLKPSEELMIRALDRSGAKAEESVFIDDKPENLVPAAKLRIRVHQYETYNGLLEFLETNGLGDLIYPN